MYIFGILIGKGCIFAILSCFGYIFQIDSMGMNNILNPAMFNTKTSFKSLVFLRICTIKTTKHFLLEHFGTTQSGLHRLSRKQIVFFEVAYHVTKQFIVLILQARGRKAMIYNILFHLRQNIVGFKILLRPMNIFTL